MNKEKFKILFVCMGNICRSPTAEGVFRFQAAQRGMQDLFEIDSAGTHAYHVGEPPDSRSQVAAMKKGIDLSNQRARQIDESDFYYYDYIFAMDAKNLANLKMLCPSQHQHKLALILDNVEGTRGKSVPDPYFSGDFNNTLTMVNDAVACFFKKNNPIFNKIGEI